ncbi:iron export ABC transporter permease subunit FetB [Clostridium carnis]
MNNVSLILTSFLLVIPIIISYKEKLQLEKEIIISIIRAVIQLVIVGYILELIFGANNKVITVVLITIIIFNASYNTINRAKNIKRPLLISLISITSGTSITLGVLVISGAIKFVPNEVIAVSGMIVSNSMVAINLCYKNLDVNFKRGRGEIEAKLSLGSNIKTASMDIIRESIKVAIMPTIDSAKTLGIVSLPGMMTGLILGGASPLVAIKFQIMVTFMLLTATTISAMCSSYLAYKSYFNDRAQLIVLKDIN